jgi:hypothetical protein
MKVEEMLIRLMRDLCEELGLPEEKDEHAPILEALNEAYNLALAAGCARGQTEVERLQTKLAQAMKVVEAADKYCATGHRQDYDAYVIERAKLKELP